MKVGKNMKEKFSDKHPIVASVLWNLFILIVTFFAGMISVVAKISSEVTMMCGFMLLTVVMALYMNQAGGLKKYGFDNFINALKENKMYCLLLFAIGLMNIITGISSEITSNQVIYLIVFMAVVAFVEESLYRGIILQFLLKKGKWFAITVSAILFGISHSIHLLDGKSLQDTIIQVLFAFFIGIVLAELALISNSIFPGMLFHFINNMTSSIAQENVSYQFIVGCIVVTFAILLSGLLVPKVKSWKEEAALESTV
jgi:membrane protease YdiL (CAAX protease family)